MQEHNWLNAASAKGWELLISDDALFLDNVPSRDDARQFISLFAKQLANAAVKMQRTYFQVRYPGCTKNSCRVPASLALSPSSSIKREKQIGDKNQMNAAIEIPNGIWMGGQITMTRSLYNALGEMIDSDQPQGLVTADTSLQIWVNPAAVQLFNLQSIEEAVPRDTSQDWLPVDLERKRQMIRDAGESSFEIDYSTCVGDGTWKKLVNRYRLVDNRYLVGTNISSEIIERPSVMA